MKEKASMEVLFNNSEKIDISNIQKETKHEVLSKYKAARKAKKITQVELSKLTGIPQPNITRFESDKSNPTLEMMIKMAAALGKKLTISLEDIEN